MTKRTCSSRSLGDCSGVNDGPDLSGRSGSSAPLRTVGTAKQDRSLTKAVWTSTYSSSELPVLDLKYLQLRKTLRTPRAREGGFRPAADGGADSQSLQEQWYIGLRGCEMRRYRWSDEVPRPRAVETAHTTTTPSGVDSWTHQRPRIAFADRNRRFRWVSMRHMMPLTVIR